jgi:hypothetical protein
VDPTTDKEISYLPTRRKRRAFDDRETGEKLPF